MTEQTRNKVLRCSAITTAPPSNFISTTLSWEELQCTLHAEAVDYVRRYDAIEMVPRTFDAPYSFVHHVLSASVRCFPGLSCINPVRSTLENIFSPEGEDAMDIQSKSALRAHREERSTWADLLIRSYTIHHNGLTTYHTLLDRNLDQPNGPEITADSKSRFHKAARQYRVPTEASIRAKMPSGPSDSTHPYLAAGRYLTVAGIRALADGVQAVQQDPCISSNQRDNGAYGERPVHQLKDLGHTRVPAPEDIPPGTKKVHTIIDCLAYDTSLAKYSGDDMIIWASYYPELAGQTSESIYYADSAKTFVEVIGLNKATAIYKKQYAWDFTSSDVVYIENEDRSAFTIYNVLRYPQPDLLKQVVFLCALQTVNMPYAIADSLVKWTKDHELASVGITTPGPCKNVVLVPRDPKRPATQDILVMANGTPGAPSVSIKYRSAISPRSCATLPTEVYDYLKYLNSHGGRGLTVHEVIKRLEHFAVEGEDVCVPGSAAYCELLRTVAWWGDLPNVVYYGPKTSPDLAPTEAETAKAVMGGPKLTPNNPGTLAKTPAAMEAYVSEKLVGMRNDTQPTKEWVEISEIMLDRFIKCIEKESGVRKGSVLLEDAEHVLASRTKAAQKERQVTDGLGPTLPEIGRVENKIEAGHKVGACPRGVQNPSADISLATGRLGKTIEQILKPTTWYNPGCSPEELTASVHDTYLTSQIHESKYDSGGVRSVDYTGADEKHSKHSNRIQRRLLNHFMSAVDKAEALAIHDSSFNMRLQVGKKVMSSGYKNSSGTGTTTCLNSLTFAEHELETTVIAMVFRSMEDEGDLEPGEYIISDDGEPRPFPKLTKKIFLKHLRLIQKTWDLHKIGGHHVNTFAIDIAYDWIGPKYGDDGLDPGTPYVSDEIWHRAMLYTDKMDGFVRKLETTSALDEERCEYLSRIHPCPLNTVASYCKVEKAVDKLSIAVNRDREKYIFKLCGYWTTDRNTPIVGALLTALGNMYGIELTQLDEAQLAVVRETDRELYHKIVGGPTPWDGNADDWVYQCVADDYGMCSGELREFDARLRSQSTWKGIQAMMLPAKIISETCEDPLGLQIKSDPSGVARVPAFSTTKDGLDPRMCDFEAGSSTDLPTDSARNDAAIRGLFPPHWDEVITDGP